MSAVRFFDDVPHIVRYGMHDETDEKCWIWFWRNGVRIKIEVKKEDVLGTIFYREWKPLLREHTRGDRPLSQWVESQWYPLCDLLISTAMPILKNLAPDRLYWVTLKDYLHTPAYRLRLVASTHEDQVGAEVEDGPSNTGAYDLAPVAKSEISLPDGVQQYTSGDLTVLNKERDWRRGPEDVCSTDGRMFSFLGCQRSSMDSTTGKVSNSSLNAIGAYLRLATIAQAKPDEAFPEALPTVRGIVTDELASKAPSTHTDKGTDREEAIVHPLEVMVAGILLSWPSSRKTLAQVVQESAQSDSHRLLDKSKNWRARIGETLDYLHAHGIYMGGRKDWSYFNAYTVSIDADGKAWLALSAPPYLNGTEVEVVQRACERDKRALADLFDGWLSNALASKLSD